MCHVVLPKNEKREEAHTKTSRFQYIREAGIWTLLSLNSPFVMQCWLVVVTTIYRSSE